MLQSALSSSCALRSFALPSTARVTTFFLFLASTNPPLSEQRSPFGLFLLAHLLDVSQEKPRRFGSHSWKIFLSALLKRLFRVALRLHSGPLSSPSCRRAFHPVAVLACREVYQNHPTCQFFSICFCREPFTHFVTSINNIQIMNALDFCHTPPSPCHFFEHFLP